MLPSTLNLLQSDDPDLVRLRTVLETLRTTGELTAIDLHTGYLFYRTAGKHRLLAALLGVSLSRLRGQGHVCLDLNARPAIWCSLLQQFELSATTAALGETGLISTPGRRAPLVMEGHRVWIHRAWRAESRLAVALCERMDRDLGERAPALSIPDLDALQLKAIRQAMVSPVCAVSGGPGTGKTTVAAEIIARLLETDQLAPERIALAAPTGKAAARLQMAVNQAMGRRGLKVELEEARTLHRLLRFSPARRAFIHHADHPLAADLVVLDEASMVDLEMMSALLDALPTDCRLVLLGDRDQLASVAPGSVMADICLGVDRPDANPRRRQRIVLLEKSFRFAADSGIAALAGAIRGGDPDRVLATLGSGHQDLGWTQPIHIEDPVEWLRQRLPETLISGLQNPDPARALAASDGFRVLCAHRAGPLGTRRFNRALVRALAAQGVAIDTTSQHNQLVLVTANDYRLGIFNGDVGLIRQEPDTQPMAWFAAESHPRGVPARRLSHTEPAFAMTIHKSQGSEYDHLVVVLPEPPSPLLTRELLYTAVTRARRGLTVVASEAAIRSCVNQRTVRYSGLGERIWQPPAWQQLGLGF